MESEQRTNWGLRLPSRIASAIFSKLPISNLPACRSVSKSWNRLILEYAATTASSTRKAMIYATNDDDPSNFDPCFLNPKIHCFDIDTFRFVASCTLVGSLTELIDIFTCCNGLLFLENGGIDIGRQCPGIFNPMTHEFFRVPAIDDIYIGFYHGFGFCPRTKEYKLFLAPGPEPECGTDMKILRFGRNPNQWISVALPFRLSIASHGLYMDGVLYWLGREEENESVITIYALDVETERFEVVAELEAGAYPDRAFLTPFNGTIYAQFFIFESSQIQMWRMQSKDSWVKEFIVCGDFSHRSFELLASDDEKIFVRINENLFWMNKSATMTIDMENKIKALNIPSDGRRFGNLSICLIETLHFGSLSSILAGHDPVMNG